MFTRPPFEQPKWLFFAPCMQAKCSRPLLQTRLLASANHIDVRRRIVKKALRLLLFGSRRMSLFTDLNAAAVRACFHGQITSEEAKGKPLSICFPSS